MKKDIDNRMRRITVFTLITAILKLKAVPEMLDESVEDLTTLLLSGAIMAVHSDKYEPYPFDQGMEWVDMFKSVEDSLEKNFPEVFSKIIIS